MIIKDTQFTVGMLKLLQKKKRERAAHFLTYSLNHMHVDDAKCQHQQ